MNARRKPLRSAAVLGAGTMGAQIAAHLANAGMRVLLLDLAASEGPRNALVERNLKAALRARPSPVFTDGTVTRISTGNLSDDFHRIADVDWVIEAVVERLDVKQELMARVEQYARADAIVSSNTSGIPIRAIVAGRRAAFRKRVLGTHFFNPTRYLELLELIPTEDTEKDIIEAVAAFGRVHLGKGIVIAKDSPYFIGNRIGVYSILGTIEYYTDGQYTIEEIETLTGPLVGRTKSATFRVADLVGLDVIEDIGTLLYELLPDDESRDRFKVPPVIGYLVAKGALGAKSGAGFFRKEGRNILSLNLRTGTYQEAKPLNLGNIQAIRKVRKLKDRLKALYADDGRAGTFFRATTLDTLGYAARRLGEIADSPADIDNAMRWGFGWELGPFQVWDALGFDRVRSDMSDAGVALPAWVAAMPADAAFYRDGKVFVPSENTLKTVYVPPDEISLAAVKTRPSAELWANEEAGLLDLGEGVALFEFRSKASTMSTKVIGGLMEAIDLVENDPSLRGMVIGNEGKNFSAGANLREMESAVVSSQLDTVDAYINAFQQAMQRVHYAAKPVVVAVHQRALGGGCELVMACTNPIVAAESYIGLVEVGVGLIPAGGGCMRIASMASASRTAHDRDILAALQPVFFQVATGKVGTSAADAIQMGLLPQHANVVMRSRRRFHAAKWTVISLYEKGYMPPTPVPIRVLGQPGFAALRIGVHQQYRGGFASAYDQHLAEQVAYVMTGGALSGAQEVTEQFLLDLERSAFMKLLKNPRTLQRVSGMLKTGRPVRN